MKYQTQIVRPDDEMYDVLDGRSEDERRNLRLVQ